jgi:tetratricopeptide (TPR) repeat protein
MKHFVATFACCLFVAGTSPVFGAGGSFLGAPPAPPDFSQTKTGQMTGSLMPQKTKTNADAVTPYNEGITFLRAKNYGAAVPKFEASIRAKQTAEAHLLAAFCLRQLGPASYAASLQHLNAALKLNPKYAEAYESRGVLYVRMGKKEDAQKDLASLKELNPKLTPGLEVAIKTAKDVDSYQ